MCIRETAGHFLRSSTKMPTSTPTAYKGFRLGDVIEQFGSRGIVVCLDPMIMRHETFGCYSVVRPEEASLLRRESIWKEVPVGVVDRVRKYLASEN